VCGRRPWSIAGVSARLSTRDMARSRPAGPIGCPAILVAEPGMHSSVEDPEWTVRRRGLDQNEISRALRAANLVPGSPVGRARDLQGVRRALAPTWVELIPFQDVGTSPGGSRSARPHGRAPPGFIPPREHARPSSSRPPDPHARARPALVSSSPSLVPADEHIPGSAARLRGTRRAPPIAR
jgi:hypothetical protein